MITESHVEGTSSSRGYTTARHGRLDPPDPFLSRTSLRAWPRGGSAERPSMLTILTGPELGESWDRCASALTNIYMYGMSPPGSSWISKSTSAALSRLVGAPDGGARNDAHAAACCWVMYHILGVWRTREAMRLHRGWGLLEAGLDPIPGCIRAPEDLLQHVLAGSELRIDPYGASLVLAAEHEATA